jgi:hypothetical protein
MLMIGVDFHTRFQQIAMVDTESGDFQFPVNEALRSGWTELWLERS